MNAQVIAITNALKTDDDKNLHEELVIASQALRKALDKITGAVADREARYATVAALQAEMKAAVDDMDNNRSITKIAGDLQRANNAIDKEIDKVYLLIAEADDLRTQIVRLTDALAAIPLAATAA